MWKYKFSCPFGGYGAWALLCSALPALLLIIVLTAAGIIPEDMLHFLAMVAGIPLIVLLTVALWVRRPRPNDAEYRADAEVPEWHKNNTRIICAMQEKTRSDFIFGAILTLAIALYAAIMWPFTQEAHRTWLLISGCAVILFAAVVLIGQWVFWRHPPKTMQYATVPIAYSYRVWSMGRYTRYAHVAVYFLPSGKYFAYYSAAEPPADICFVRLHGVILRVQPDFLKN